ncbi:MAG: ThuA domain-containing protein [Agriterribacter sp.]
MKLVQRLLALVLFLPAMLFAQKGKKLHAVFISASNEYVSHITLNEFKKKLEATYSNVEVTVLQANGPINEKDEYSNLDGTDILKTADVLLIFARRTTIKGKAIEDIKAYVNSGKPLVALRTASHGFQEWPEFDKEILGGNYSFHYDGEPEKRLIGADGMRYVTGEPSGPVQQVSINEENKQHPVLAGIKNFSSKYSLYKTAPIAADAKLLLTGKTTEGTEPLAWARTIKGKMVYIALGGVQDWQNPIFVQLVTNALFWTADFKAKKK